MFGKKKGFTASQSKRMSRRMESSTIGTHVSRPSARGKRGRSSGPSSAPGASHVEFSSGRRSNEAARGFVRQVGTSATSGEDDASYARRVSRLGYVQEIQRRSRRRRVALLVVLAILVAAVAVAVGVFAYFGSSDAKLSLGSSNAQEALVEAAEGQPYYVLCAARVGAASGDRDARADAFLLVRVDEEKRVLSFVSLPSRLDVRLSDGSAHPLCEARSVGGDAELIRAVSELIDGDVSHFVSVDADGIADMVDALGGVTVSVAEEVDDPRAGTSVIAAGEQSLDGARALTLLRASNYATGFARVSENRIDFTTALLAQALSSEGLSFAALVGDAGNYLSTDWSSSDLIALGDAFRPFDQATVYSCSVPGYETKDDERLFECDEQTWEAMLERLKAGEDPNAVEGSEASVNSSDVEVEVRNGSGASGAAARAGEMLSAAGYAVGDVGNVDDNTVYPETLVIYKDPANEGAAKAVTSAISGGRVVNGGDFYTFDADVLVIIGLDWMPTV